MFKKFKEFYKRNRVYSILMIVSIICIVSILVGVIFYFLGQTTKDKYGNRLEGRESVMLKDDDIKKVEDSITTNDLVNKVELDIKGKLIYVNIILNSGKHSDAEAIAQSSLELFSEDVRNYFDIEFNVDNKEPGDENFPIMGYLKAGNTTIRWTKYVQKVVE